MASCHDEEGAEPILLKDWFVRLRDDEIVVDGVNPEGTRWRSSVVDRRLSARKVVTKGGRVYAMEGSMREETSNLPKRIASEFRDGFPENWKDLCRGVVVSTREAEEEAEEMARDVWRGEKRDEYPSDGLFSVSTRQKRLDARRANRQSGARQDTPTFVGRSSIHGWGLFASRDIRKGEKTTYYDGERVDWKTAMERPFSHIRSVVHGFVAIDGLRHPEEGRGKGSFCNHSETPNCISWRSADLEPVLWVKAKRDISEGEELTIRYDQGYWTRLGIRPHSSCPNPTGSSSPCPTLVAKSALLRKLGRDGWGLFASRRLKPGEIVGSYEGEVVASYDKEEDALRHKDGNSDKMIVLRRKGTERRDGEKPFVVVDGRSGADNPPYIPMVNDVRGVVPKMTPNCIIKPGGRMIVRRGIPAFDTDKSIDENLPSELCIDYGEEYWL